MKENIFHREVLTSLGLATGKAKRAAKYWLLINNKLFKDLLELLSLLEARVMALLKQLPACPGSGPAPAPAAGQPLPQLANGGSPLSSPHNHRGARI
jgi:hypothetical protein